MGEKGLKKRWRFMLMLLYIVCMSVLSCGCQGQIEKSEETKTKEDKIQIGLCFDSFLIERWERDRDVFVSTAKELGAEVNVQNANGSAKTQAEQIDYLISKKVDVIVIISIDSEEIMKAVAKAKNAGIYVVAYDRMIRDANVDLYVSFDNEKVGEIMADSLIKAGLNKKKVLMLEGSLDDCNVEQVEKGFQAVCDQYGITVVDQMYAEGWKPELAAEYLYTHLDILNDVDAIMCGNDSIATHAVRVLAEYRKAGKILVTGQDADLEACQRIVEGTQLVTVYKPVENQAKLAAKATIALVKKEEIPELTGAVNDGTYDIPAIILDPIGVTEKNIEKEIIESGFHLKEDVYLNVNRYQ